MELSLPNPLIENTLYIYFMCQDVAIGVTKNNNFKSMPIQIIENLYENKSFFFLCIWDAVVACLLSGKDRDVFSGMIQSDVILKTLE